jgi:hypothetical protein
MSPLDSRLLHGNLYGGDRFFQPFCNRFPQQPVAQEKRRQNFLMLGLGCLWIPYLIFRKIAILE